MSNDLRDCLKELCTKLEKWKPGEDPFGPLHGAGMSFAYTDVAKALRLLLSDTDPYEYAGYVAIDRSGPPKYYIEIFAPAALELREGEPVTVRRKDP